MTYVHQDPVTKSQRFTDSAGALLPNKIDLDPWGLETQRTESPEQQPHRYTSYERDKNKSDEAMMRRYTASRNRFDQPDPYDGSYALTNPQSFNRYSYVQNDPVNFIDPTGLDGEDDPECPTCPIVDIPAEDTIYVDAGFCVSCLLEFLMYVNSQQEHSPEKRGEPMNKLMLGLELRMMRSQKPQNDNDINAVNAALSICSTGATIGQYSNVSGGMWKSTKNGNWYPLSQHGNGATGARGLAVGKATALGMLSRSMAVVGAGFSFMQMSQHLSQGNKGKGAKAALDGGMAIVGGFGGPWGAGASASYFVMDTIGWENCATFATAPCDRECRRK